MRLEGQLKLPSASSMRNGNEDAFILIQVIERERIKGSETDGLRSECFRIGLCLV